MSTRCNIKWDNKEYLISQKINHSKDRTYVKKELHSQGFVRFYLHIFFATPTNRLY